MKAQIKICFTDFWSNFDKEDNLFLNLLGEEYDVIVTDDDPDLLFYSYFGNNFTRYNCKRIYFTGENVRPNFKECDFAFSFDLTGDNPNHYRLPLYALFDDVSKLTRAKNVKEIMAGHSKFCNFIYSNPNAKLRNNFFHKLSAYKKVDSGGRVLNNIGGRVDNKLDFVSDYKFTIAFENESHRGYTTEKIFEPMLVNSLPIYHGNPEVGRDFNTKSFLNYYDFESEEALIERIIELDQNDELYAEYMSQTWFAGNKANKDVDNDNIKAFLMKVAEDQRTQVSASSQIFSKSFLVRKLSRVAADCSYNIKKLFKKYILNFNISKLIYRIKGLKVRA